MLESLFYKEWIKSRWILLIIVLALGGVIIYNFMLISQSMRVSGYNYVWEIILQNRITYFSTFKYIPLLAGVILALAQYVPEVVNQRLKLTLHLPMGEQKIMLTMLSFGILTLLALFTVSYIIIAVGLNIHFTTEIANWNLALIQPWMWGGLIAYLLTTWICIEPVWKQKIFSSIIALLLISLYYQSVLPYAYNYFLPYLITLVVLAFAFPYHALLRFKDGVQ